ncbi:MAG: PEP-CTERM sorting domain-containing protein, partial [Planctomycetota bacterium]
ENTDPEVLVAGTGTVGSVVLQEDLTISGQTRLIQGIDSSGRINDSGRWVVGADFDGDSATDDIIVGGSTAGADIVYAQEGSTIDAGFGLDPGDTWDDLSTTAIDAAGTAYWRARSLDGPSFTSANDDLIASSNNQILAQKGVDTPGNQPSSPRPYDDFDLDDLHVSADGTQYLARGDIGSPTSDDDALFVNDVIVLREGSTLSETGITGAAALTDPVGGSSDGINQQFMAGNGDWYAFGSLLAGVNDFDFDYVVRNGALLTTSGESITPGSTETWDDPNVAIQDFVFVKGNGEGDYVIGGGTSAGRQVAVLNGETVILATGDEVDLDGDGLLDGVFVGGFEFNEAAYGDNDIFYALVSLVDGTGTELGSGFISVQVPEPTTLGLLSLGTLALRRRR